MGRLMTEPPVRLLLAKEQHQEFEKEECRACRSERRHQEYKMERRRVLTMG
jgi:hypothetical protein